jgi:hypothetical protein
MKMNEFIHILYSEHFKAKRNFGIWIAILFPLLIALITNGYIIYKYGELEGSFTFNPWSILLGRYMFQFFPFLFPIIISILCYSLCDIEYKNNSYKLLFTLPIKYWKIYFAKVIFLFEIIFISTLVSYCCYLGSGCLLSRITPELHFQDFDIRWTAFAFHWKLLISLLSIASIQYCLSLMFKNFAISIGFGSFATIFSLIAFNQSSFNDYIPYYLLYKVQNAFYNEISDIEKYNYVGIGCIIIFFLLGYFILYRRKSKI